jgi:hypothetical protein
MGIIYDNFKDKVLNLWNLASKINKPIHPTITWTCGIIKGRADFLDLQVQGLALAASIIITEPVVPKIIIGWDSPIDPNTTRRDNNRRIQLFPQYLLRAMPDWKEEYLEDEYYYKPFKFKTKYLDLHRSALSVNPQPYALGLGYRSKYLGMNYVTTKYGIISDIDTICLNPCIPYLEANINTSPETFVWTNHITDINMSVGLCIYHMNKYRNIFLPKLYDIYWETHRQDSRFVPEVLRDFPETKNDLDIKIFDGEILNSEKFYKHIPRKNYFVEGKTTHYHSWKREYKSAGFIPFYDKILSDLKEQCE